MRLEREDSYCDELQQQLDVTLDLNKRLLDINQKQSIKLTQLEAQLQELQAASDDTQLSKKLSLSLSSMGSSMIMKRKSLPTILENASPVKRQNHTAKATSICMTATRNADRGLTKSALLQSSPLATAQNKTRKTRQMRCMQKQMNDLRSTESFDAYNTKSEVTCQSPDKTVSKPV